MDNPNWAHVEFIEPKFQDFFVAASNIPNGVDKFPKLRSKVELPNNTFNVRLDGGRKRSRRANRKILQKIE